MLSLIHMFNMKFLSTLLTIFLLQKDCWGLSKLEEKYHWAQVDFHFENKAARQEALNNRQFIPENNIPFGVEVWKNKVFITIPRRSPGVLSTLNYFNLDCNETSPLLTPYPDWKSNEPSVDHITSTYRVSTDACDRLWTIDTGSVVGNTIQPPRILIFDLNTNTLIKTHRLDSSRYTCNPTFTNIYPDVRDSCDDAYAYAVNPTSSSLLVYSFKDNRSWSKTHSYFYPDPFQMDYKINNVRIPWTDGLIGFALSELNQNGDRKAYLHPMSSLHEFVVDTKLLRDQNSTLQDQVKVLASRDTTFQAATAAYDEKSGVLFYSLVNKNGIGCWNTRKLPNKGHNMDVVAADDQTMVYSSDVKVDRSGNLWAISNRIPIILYGNDKPKPGEIRFRIFTAPVKQIIKNTHCDYHTSQVVFSSKKN